ncbi:hypothetical protein ABE444_10860 [Brevundimonas pondensis]|uniref:hypothetical protein n=1 Tax=Brevundimonas pondensis TaxID=2774189 RepID=UPI00320AC2D7
MVSLLLPVADGGCVDQALASGCFPRAGGLGFGLGFLGGVMISDTVSAPVSTVGAEDQEGGEDGEGEPGCRGQGTTDAEGEGNHAAISTRVRNQP